MSSINLLYQRRYVINDKISVIIPTVGEIVDHEDEYYDTVSLLTAMPIDLMVQLDDMGIDFTEINEYELFLTTFILLRALDTTLIFDKLDLKGFEYCKNNQNGQTVLYDEKNGIMIDQAIHRKVATVLRKIHHIEQDRRRPANDEAKEYMLKRAREKARRRKTKVEDSQLEQLITALVNTCEFKYDYETVRDLSIYQFNQSLKQIVHKNNYEHKMNGIYAGTIDPKGLDQDELNWLIHK